MLASLERLFVRLLEQSAADCKRLVMKKGRSMATIFTKIINGEIPSRFVWKDERCVAFLTTGPIRPGHTLVVPREEIDHWLDLDPSLLQHLAAASQSIGKALQHAFSPLKVGVMIAGLEVPHVHIHLIPVQDEARDLYFDNADHNPDPAMLDDAAEKIRASLRELGYTEVAE
jgi:histidine triad (HIT) family protein